MVKPAYSLFIAVLFLTSCSTLSSSEKATLEALPSASHDSKTSSLETHTGDPLDSSESENKEGLSGKITMEPESAGDGLVFSGLLPLNESVLPIYEADLKNGPEWEPDKDLQTDPALEDVPENLNLQYDVPIVINESVETYLTYFTTKIHDKFSLWLERSGRYLPMMRQVFKEEGLPQDLVYISLIESGFNPYAYSRAKAVGTWQFIRSTGRMYGLKVNSWVDERRDPEKATRAAARHLRDLYEDLGSWPLAMAAYNAGQRKVTRALRLAKAETYWEIRETRYIRPETKGYVPKYMAATIIAKNPDRYGFTLNYQEPMAYDKVTVQGSADLRVMAEAAGISYKELKDLNPELRTVLTPVYKKSYDLKLPMGKAESFKVAYAKIPEHKKIIGSRYKIKKNDTLSGIAQKYGTSVTLLREVNNIPRRHLLQIGQTLFIPKLPSTASKTTISKKDAVTKGNHLIYSVKRGDTLWDISQAFKISIEDIKKFNGMRRNTIRPGEQLILGLK